MQKMFAKSKCETIFTCLFYKWCIIKVYFAVCRLYIIIINFRKKDYEGDGKLYEYWKNIKRHTTVYNNNILYIIPNDTALLNTVHQTNIVISSQFMMGYSSKFYERFKVLRPITVFNLDKLQDSESFIAAFEPSFSFIAFFQPCHVEIKFPLMSLVGKLQYC